MDHTNDDAADPRQALADVVRNLKPGQSVIAGTPVTVTNGDGTEHHYPAGTRLGRALAGHPWWCAGPPVCKVDVGLPHGSQPEQVADAVVMAMSVDGDPPMITISDGSSTVILLAATASSVAHTVRVVSQRVATPD